jgi:hypothetical protein
MGEDVQAIGQASKAYDRCVPRSDECGVTLVFTEGVADCYLLAVSRIADATLLTFDRGLASTCRKAPIGRVVGNRA